MLSKESLIRFVDKYTGRMFVILFIPIAEFLHVKKAEYKKILVIAFWGIGSSVLALPAIKEIKNRDKNTKITVLCSEFGKYIFENQDFIDEVKTVNLNIFSIIRLSLTNIFRYDVVYDMEYKLTISALIATVVGRWGVGFKGQFRSFLYDEKIMFDPSRHVVWNNLNLVGVQKEKLELEPIVPKAMIKIHYPKKRVGMAPGAGTAVPEKKWSTERFAELADKINVRYDARTLFFGSKDEFDMIEKIRGLMTTQSVNLSTLPLELSIKDINQCDLFIGNDAGALHLATAQGVRTIGLFGPETPVLFGALGEECINVYKKLDCSPCIIIYKNKYKNCGDNKCMRAISVDEVFKKVRL